jgi:hypothetical protein
MEIRMKFWDEVVEDDWGHIPIWLRISQRYLIDPDIQEELVKHGSRHLTDDEVRKIRTTRGRVVDIAKQMGLNAKTVGNVRRRRTYAHVEDL